MMTVRALWRRRINPPDVSVCGIDLFQKRRACVNSESDPFKIRDGSARDAE